MNLPEMIVSIVHGSVSRLPNRPFLFINLMYLKPYVAQLFEKARAGFYYQLAKSAISNIEDLCDTFVASVKNLKRF